MTSCVWYVFFLVTFFDFSLPLYCYLPLFLPHAVVVRDCSNNAILCRNACSIALVHLRLTQFVQEIDQITDEAVYNQLLASDMTQGRWTLEDPSLQRVVQWLWARK